MELLGCPVPDGLRIDLEHGLWIAVDGDGVATLGLLAPFASFAGRFTAVGYRPIGPRIAAGRSVATLESVRLTAPVPMPSEGIVLERNERLSDRPRLLNDAPYGEGWLLRFRPDPSGGLDHLPRTEEAREALVRQIEERRVRCYAALPDLEVYEIGAECRAILARLDEELAHRAPGEVVLLVVDDPTAPIEMVRWSDRTGYPILEQRRADGLWHFLVRKIADPTPKVRPYA